jgi:hypothetical protein
MYNLFLAVNASKMNVPFSAESFDTFMKGLKMTGLGMTTVIGVLFLIYLIVKLLIRLFPGNK